MFSEQFYNTIVSEYEYIFIYSNIAPWQKAWTSRHYSRIKINVELNLSLHYWNSNREVLLKIEQRSISFASRDSVNLEIFSGAMAPCVEIIRDLHNVEIIEEESYHKSAVKTMDLTLNYQESNLIISVLQDKPLYGLQCWA